MTRHARFALAVLFWTLSPLWATETSSDTAPPADFNAATWALNGSYSLSSLKGKLVVLYFYESG